MSLLTAAPPRLYPHHNQEKINTASTPRPNSAAISYWQDLFSSQRLSPPEYKYLFPDLSNVENEAVKELLSYKLTHEMHLCSDTQWAGLNAVGLTAFWLKVLSEPRIPQLRACKLMFVGKLVQVLAGSDLLTHSLLAEGEGQMDESPPMPAGVIHPPTFLTSNMENIASPRGDNQTSANEPSFAPHLPSDPCQGQVNTPAHQSLRKEKTTTPTAPTPPPDNLGDDTAESCLPDIKEEATLIPDVQLVDYPTLNGHDLPFSPAAEHSVGEAALAEQPPDGLALGEHHQEKIALGEQAPDQLALGEQPGGELVAGDQPTSGLSMEMSMPDSMLYQEDGKPLPISIDGQPVDESDLWTEEGDGANITFSCKTCHYVSTYKSRIKQHIRSVHSSIKPYKCDYCDHTTAIRASLTKHINSVHRKMKPFSCSLCDYTCSLKKSLEVHMAGVHQKQYKHRCPYCEYTASAKNVVDIHIQAVHMKERPYKCPHCEYRSAYPQYIPKHIAAVHDRQKPYACPHCPYRSSYKTYLQKHCDAVHNNIKPFSCPHCSYVTSYSQYLNKHISAVHNDEKPHKCPFCQFRCAYKQYINKHIELVHPGLTNPNKTAPPVSTDGTDAKPDVKQPVQSTATLTSQALPTQVLPANFLPAGFGHHSMSTPDRMMLGNPLANMTFPPALPGHADMFRRFGGFTPPTTNFLPREQPAATSLSFDMFTRDLAVSQYNSNTTEVPQPDNAAPTDQLSVDVTSGIAGTSSVPSSSTSMGNMYVWPGMTS